MKTCTVHPSAGTSYPISGTSLEDAIATQYPRLLKSGRLGEDHAGYLKHVTWRYVPTILDGRGGVQGILEWQLFHIGRVLEDHTVVTTIEIAAQSEEVPIPRSHFPANVKCIANTMITYVILELGQTLLSP